MTQKKKVGRVLTRHWQKIWPRFPIRIRIDHWWQIISESIYSSISKTCEQVADVYHLHISRATWHHWQQVALVIC